MGTRAARGFGQYSGVARAVERVGERWALLIVRDLLGGARRYSDLKASLPRIPTNILSDRLKELQEAGIVRRVPSVRGGYELTPLGRGLEPVVAALERWGWSVLGDPGEGETMSADALGFALSTAFRPDAAATLPPTEYVLSLSGAEPPVAVSAIVVAGTLDVVAVGSGALPQPRRRSAHEPVPEAVLELELTPTALRALLAEGAPRANDDGPFAGDAELLARFVRTFRIDPVEPSPGTARAAGAAVA